jgi:hypothetical protein
MFWRVALNSTHPSNHATGFSRKPQVVGEQNESLRHPESKRREQACSMPIGLGGLAEFVIGRAFARPVGSSHSRLSLVHFVRVRAVATLQPHIGDDAIFCRAGINTVIRQG